MKNLARFVLLVTLAPGAYSQTVLYTFDGDSNTDAFGASVSGAGDVNGDGFDDVIVGARWDDNNGTDSGSARVFSGVDGSILYTFNGIKPGHAFGASVSGAGDVNGDGFDDLIVGAPGKGSGRARVLSGKDGKWLYRVFGDSQGDGFGASVSGAGDVNGDGFADFIVSAPLDDNNGDNSGSARVFSGVDGSILYTFNGDSPDDRFGASVSGAGDVNGDGFADFIVSAPWDCNNGTSSGSARVFSGVDGSVLYTFDGDSANDFFGRSVSGAGDVNGDGYDDVIVGAHWDDNNGDNSGSARVFSGMDGSVLYTFDGDSPGESLGSSVSGAGDVNGDGYDDVIVFGNVLHSDGTGSAKVFSGVNGSLLHTLPTVVSWGNSVSGAGDVNGDGCDDLIVGDSGDGAGNTGRAQVFSGGDHGVGQNYCGPANFNSTGQSAVISANGSTAALGNFVTLTAGRLPLNVFGYFLNSDVQGFTPFPPGSQGNLCLGGSIGRHAKDVANTGGAGELVLDLDLTDLPRPNGSHSVVAGETWNFQCWFRDSNPGATSNFTDAVSITFE